MKKIITYTMFIFQFISTNSWSEADIAFRGILVEEPCVLAPADSEIDIEFGSVINKLIYNHQRTDGKPFTLHLEECDLSLSKTVRITFLGSEDLLQSGMIALDPASTAAGIALGIESSDGTLIPINKASNETPIKKGSNQLLYKIFISGEPTAIEKKKIITGYFFSKIIFSLDYE